ncbi:MAG: hypothetical protein Q9195_001122 [Heterodermia aff. obscurata]
MLSEAENYEEQQRKGGTCYRSQHYYDTLRLLRQIIADTDHGIHNSRQGLETAIRAGIIARWLSKYPWGGKNRSQEEKRKVFKARLDVAPDDILTQWIIRELATDFKKFPMHNDAGIHLLEMHELVDADFIRTHITPRSYDRNGTQVLSPGPTPWDPSLENAHDADVTEPSSDWTQYRPGREESMEEQLLRRRRRREAMVIGGEGRPFALAETRRHTSDTLADHIDTPGRAWEVERMSGAETLENTREVAEEDRLPSEAQDAP